MIFVTMSVVSPAGSGFPGKTMGKCQHGRRVDEGGGSLDDPSYLDGR